MRFVAISILTIVASLSGCGNLNIKKKNCIPPLAYISTNLNKFVTYRLVGRGLSKWTSYDVLQVSEAGDWMLKISGGVRSSRISYMKKKEVELEWHPPGTVLSLTGEGITRKPYGLMEAFNSERTYLKGYIDEKTVWFPALLLHLLNKSGNKLNIVSNRQLGLDKSYKFGWRCINK